MDVDSALSKLGAYGKWQMTFYTLLCIASSFPASWHMLAIVFIGSSPDHHCKIPEGHSVNESIPMEYQEETEVWKRSKCMENQNFTMATNMTQKCSNGHWYDPEPGNTIVSDWNLVCEYNILSETTQTVLVVGVMVGALGFSALADAIGRKPIYLFSQWAMVVVGITCAFVDNYYVFAAARFLTGALQQGILLTGFVLSCEIFPAAQRTMAGTVIELYWAVGMMFFALFAYLVRNWRYLQLLISLPGVLTIAFYWILPESIVWQCANNEKAAAEETLKKAAKFNGVEMPEHPLMTTEEWDRHTEEQAGQKAGSNRKNGPARQKLEKLRAICAKTEKDEVEKGAKKYTVLDIFKSAKLRLYTIIMCLLWCVNSLVYYGLSLSTGSLAGDKYVNFFLSGAVEFPAYLATVFILAKFGRRWPVSLFMITAGVSLFISVFIPHETANGTSLVPLITTLAMIGKFGITGSFGSVFLYAPELFPTNLRQVGMGVASVFGRIGNMLAPYSAFVAKVYPWFPGVVFGIISIIVGLLTLLLPETLNRPLADTVEDIEKWNRTMSKEEKREALELRRADQNSKA